MTQKKLQIDTGGNAAGDAAVKHSTVGPLNVALNPERYSMDLERAPLRVLLVEDSALLVQRISEIVNDLPNVRLEGNVNSEAAALARLDSGDIDAVILDLQLHTGSGFGVLRALRNKRGLGPSVIVFTNFAIAAYRESALALGASHFLDKSRDYDQLPSVLQQLSETAH